MKNKLEEGQDKTFVVLQEGHDKMSGEIIHLLSFNMQQIKDNVRKEYQNLQDNYGDAMTEKETLSIKNFLSKELNSEITEQEFNDFVQEADDMQWLILCMQLIPLSMRINVIAKNDFGDLYNPMKTGIKKLDIAAHLPAFSKDTLDNIFDSLWDGLEFLEIDGCNLDVMSAQNIVSMFATLPKGLKGLDISKNFLGRHGFDNLKVMISVLSEDLKVLKIENNLLSELTPEEIIRLVSLLPSGLKYLNLSGNSLGIIGLSNLQKLMAVLPKGLRQLSFKNNSLPLYTKEDLGVPDSVIFDI